MEKTEGITDEAILLEIIDLKEEPRQGLNNVAPTLETDRAEILSPNRSNTGQQHNTSDAKVKFQSGASSTLESSPPIGIDAAPRLVMFDKIVKTFLEKLLASGSFQRFAHCYQSFYNLQPEVTASVHERFLSLLRTSIQDEINQVKEEGNLEALFKILDRIVEESKDKKGPAWRPSGIPEEDIRSWLVPYILNQRQYLRKLQREMQEENAKLMKSVLAGREKIMDLQQKIQLRCQALQAVQKEKQQLMLAIENPNEESLI